MTGAALEPYQLVDPASFDDDPDEEFQVQYTATQEEIRHVENFLIAVGWRGRYGRADSNEMTHSHYYDVLNDAFAFMRVQGEVLWRNHQ